MGWWRLCFCDDTSCSFNPRATGRVDGESSEDFMSKYMFVSESLKDILMQALHAKPLESMNARVTFEWRRCGNSMEEVPIKIKKTMDEVENTSLKRWTRLQHRQNVAAPQ